MQPTLFPPSLRATAVALALALPGGLTWAVQHTAPRLAAAAAATAALPAVDDLPRPSLPQTAAVEQWLPDAPALRDAQAMRQAAQDNGAALRAGSNGLTAQAQVQQRRIDAPPDSGRFTEWQLLVNRQLCLPAQQQADSRLADALEQSAQATLALARQQTLAQLFTAWFAAQRAQAEAQLAQQDLDLIDAQVKALQRRQTLGDASVLEVQQMQAERARAQTALTLAQGLAASSRAALFARYPTLAQDDGLRGQADATALALPAWSAAQWLEQVTAANPLLAEQRAALQKAQALAAQAHAARTPQPTVGAYLGSERGGNERIVGVQVAVPFGTAARAAQERAALAEVDAAQWRLREQQSVVEADVQRLLAQAKAQAAAVDAAEDAARLQTQSAARVLRAYQLGEAGLSEWLLARRGAVEAMRLALQTRYEAAATAALLRLQAGL